MPKHSNGKKWLGNESACTLVWSKIKAQFLLTVTAGANPHYWGKDQTVSFMGVNCRFRCEEERKQKKIGILAVRQIESHAQNAPKTGGVHLSFAEVLFHGFCSFVLRHLCRVHKVSTESHRNQRRHIFLVACVSL